LHQYYTAAAEGLAICQSYRQASKNAAIIGTDQSGETFWGNVLAIFHTVRLAFNARNPQDKQSFPATVTTPVASAVDA
jgi:hypothetical protein